MGRDRIPAPEGWGIVGEKWSLGAQDRGARRRQAERQTVRACQGGPYPPLSDWRTGVGARGAGTSSSHLSPALSPEPKGRESLLPAPGLGIRSKLEHLFGSPYPTPTSAI